MTYSRRKPKTSAIVAASALLLSASAAAQTVDPWTDELLTNYIKAMDNITVTAH